MLSKEDIQLALNIIDDLFEIPESVPFRTPVDYKALHLIDYPVVIKHPMDLGTVKKKLKGNKYKNMNDVLEDIQQTWNNCKLYNQEGSLIYKHAQKLEKATKKLVKKYLPNVRSSQNAGVSSVQKHKPEHPKNTPQEESKMGDSVGGDHESGKLHFNQKVKFSQKVKKLTQEQLVKVVQIILDGNSGALKEIGRDKMQIKVDDLNAETFQRVTAYMDDIFSAEDKHLE